MTDTLFVQLIPPLSLSDEADGNAIDCAAKWLRLPGQAMTDTSNAETGQLSRFLQQPPANCRWIVLLPGEDVLTTSVKLPKKRRRQALKALPYLLEDSMASDAALEHLAVGPENTQGETLVAITRKQKLRDLLRVFTDAGVTPYAMLPDYAMLPEDPDIWRILIDGDRALVRCPDSTGFSAPVTRLAQLLNSAHDPQSGSTTRSAQCIRAADAGTPAALPGNWHIDEQLVADPLQHLAADASMVPLNLLQDEFKVVQQDSWNWRPWATAAVLAGVSITIALLATGLETARFNREFDRLQASMFDLAREALPEARQIRDPQTQLLIAWRQLQNGGAGGGEFLPLLNRVSAAISRQPVSVSSIHFRDGTLTVALQGSSLQQLDELRQQIEQLGLDAALLNAGTDADSARSDLVIRSAAAPEPRSAG
jgi:general secretion pathway protein L